MSFRLLKVIRYCFYALATTGLVMHFALTALFLLPPNPIKTVTALDRYYIGRHFYQDWGMFAPDPIQRDISLLVQCFGEEVSTPPLDVTSGLLEARRRNNPFSAHDRLSRVPLNRALGLLTPTREETPFLAFCQENPEHEICGLLETQRELRKEALRFGLVRVASVFCADMRGRFGAGFETARVWIAISPVPRWSERYTVVRETESIELGTFELEALPSLGVWN